MSDENDWDVEKYRTDYESEEHWELKKTFIETHRHNFSEEKIICLSQIFFNIEMLGCRYNGEVMKQISEMSKGIIEDYRESRNGR